MNLDNSLVNWEGDHPRNYASCMALIVYKQDWQLIIPKTASFETMEKHVDSPPSPVIVAFNELRSSDGSFAFFLQAAMGPEERCIEQEVTNG